MLIGVHFLLTYACSFECDHCFVYSSPQARGTFTLNQIKRVFEELTNIRTIQRVYFEGGEAFLFYPLMVEGDVTPADVLYGRREQILQRREEVRIQTINRRRNYNRGLRELVNAA